MKKTDWNYFEEANEDMLQKFGKRILKESDPNGFKASDPGAKLDVGKSLVGLFFKDFPRALMAVADVVTYGKEKYSESGWLEVPDGVKRYSNALGRHLLNKQINEVDKDSGLSESAMIAWNSLAVLELELREKENGK